MPAAAQTLDPLRADPGRAAILCDVDGTLAPIVDDPDAAAVPGATREVLAKLASRYRLVACVTGRRASAARRIVGVDAITYLGNHGLELLEPGEVEPRLDAALGHRGTAASGFVARLDGTELRESGLRLEDKGPIQALHWRQAPDPELAEARAREVAERAAEQGLFPHFGRMVLELRPVAEVHKGTAVTRLLAGAGFAAAMFGGDDRTDLDAFDALGELAASGDVGHAVRVAIASAEGPADLQRRAELVVEGPAEFVDLLREL